MVLGLEVEYVGIAEVADRLVVFLAASLEVLIGKVGKTEHKSVVLSFDLSELLVVCLNLSGESLHCSEDLCAILALLLVLGDELCLSVLLSLLLIVLCDHVAAESVKLYDSVYFVCSFLALSSEASDNVFGIFSDKFDVKHCFNS